MRVTRSTLVTFSNPIGSFGLRNKFQYSVAYNSTMGHPATELTKLPFFNTTSSFSSTTYPVVPILDMVNFLFTFKGQRLVGVSHTYVAVGVLQNRLSSEQ